MPDTQAYVWSFPVSHGRQDEGRSEEAGLSPGNEDAIDKYTKLMEQKK